mmetsp:Transcript_44587/g.50384  ORF Transcript_44587/g.50384 Transcript_44587/m.50384 type:complete len:125 (+) Transcript_44587:368-742(+)
MVEFQILAQHSVRRSVILYGTKSEGVQPFRHRKRRKLCCSHSASSKKVTKDKTIVKKSSMGHPDRVGFNGKSKPKQSTSEGPIKTAFRAYCPFCTLSRSISKYKAVVLTVTTPSMAQQPAKGEE